MRPVPFEGAIEIRNPNDTTDEQCMSAWARFGFDRLYKMIKTGARIPEGLYAGVDTEDFPYYMTAWQPNKEDIDAINRGEPVYVKILSKQLPPMALFTLDENGEGNF